MDIVIDRKSNVPIYAQIERQLKEMIFSGALPPGFMLPPERRLSGGSMNPGGRAPENIISLS